MKKTRNIRNDRWQADEIKAAWDALDDGDVSTERLLQMVADTCNYSVNDVVDVMAESA